MHYYTYGDTRPECSHCKEKADAVVDGILFCAYHALIYQKGKINERNRWYGVSVSRHVDTR